jgi:hypothetical protein
VNDLSFFYYGMVCVSLALLGLLLTVLEFHRMSPSKNPIDAIIWPTNVQHVNKLASLPQGASPTGLTPTGSDSLRHAIGFTPMSQP